MVVEVALVAGYMGLYFFIHTDHGRSDSSGCPSSLSVPAEYMDRFDFDPRGQLQLVAEGLAQFVSKPIDPKVTMFLYVVKKKLLEAIGADSDMLLIHAFDAHGEEHGRANFKWALEIPGAIDKTKVTNLTGVANLQGGYPSRIHRCPANWWVDNVHTAKGTMKQFWAPLILPEVTKDTVISAIKWSEDIQRLDQSLGDCTFLIFELLASVSNRLHIPLDLCSHTSLQA